MTKQGKTISIFHLSETLYRIDLTLKMAHALTRGSPLTTKDFL